MGIALAMHPQKTRFALLALLALTSLTLAGCKRQVPDKIVQDVVKKFLRHAPNTSSAMCGFNRPGLTLSNVKVTKKDAENKGTVHVTSSQQNGAKMIPCEGDLTYAFSYKSRTIGKRTTVTWSLDDIKLTAVQTPGVNFKPVEEKPDDNDVAD
jgi:hypothetical protein